MSQVRTIKVAGFDVEVHYFGPKQGSFYYPAFSGNKEYPVTAAGFRALSSFLRTILWLQEQMPEPMKSLVIR
jgi:hypothetical protein